MGQFGEWPTLCALVGLIDTHVLLEVPLKVLVGLAVAIERPHELGISKR
jgi:hypothetical protein